MTPYSEGYHAGLVNDRKNPHGPWDLAYLPWHFGNSLGVDVHCAVVEAIYLQHVNDKETFH